MRSSAVRVRKEDDEIKRRRVGRYKNQAVGRGQAGSHRAVAVRHTNRREATRADIPHCLRDPDVETQLSATLCVFPGGRVRGEASWSRSVGWRAGICPFLFGLS
jgi:hypothetical protein